MGTAAKRIARDTYMLTDTLLGVSQFLLLGGERALLIDTGYGKKSLLKKVKKLTSLPLVVVNTHLHPDHSNGNKFFEEVLLGEGDLPERDIPSNAMVASLCAAYRESSPLLRPLVGKLEKLYTVVTGEERYSPLGAGIDLGGRVVRRIDCPGHTEGSVIFADEKEKLLFTGDAIGRAQWLFTDAASTTTGYAERWERLSPSLISYREMWISHSRKPLEIGFIEGFVAALRDVNPENCKKIKLKGAEEPILVHVGKYGGAGKITVWAFPGQVR